MKRMLSTLLGSTLVTDEGPSGRVLDFYFDDITWRLRYAMVKTRHRREVLVPASQFLPREWDLPTLPVRLGREDLETCPPAETHRPVSRQMMDIVRVAGIPLGDPHLRSFRAVRRYRVDSARGVVGSVVDFAVDDQTWSIHGLVVNTGHWLRRRTVLASLSWMKDIDWANGAIWTETHPLDWHSAPALGWQIGRKPT